MTDQTNPQEALTRLTNWRKNVAGSSDTLGIFDRDVLALLSLVEWRPFDTAPVTDQPFEVLMDGAIYKAKFFDGSRSRFAVMHHSVTEPRSHVVLNAEHDGKPVKALHEIERGPMTCEAGYSFWVRGWDFRPTHWRPLAGEALS